MISCGKRQSAERCEDLSFVLTQFQAVRLACEKVVRQLRPIIDKADPGASWEDIIAAAQGDDVGHVPTKVRCLSNLCASTCPLIVGAY